jgi:hypothetical protein
VVSHIYFVLLLAVADSLFPTLPSSSSSSSSSFSSTLLLYHYYFLFFFLCFLFFCFLSSSCICSSFTSFSSSSLANWHLLNLESFGSERRKQARGIENNPAQLWICSIPVAARAVESVFSTAFSSAAPHSQAWPAQPGAFSGASRRGENRGENRSKNGPPMVVHSAVLGSAFVFHQPHFLFKSR